MHIAMIHMFSTLTDKEVINIEDGRRLGCICDLEIDVTCGRIVKLILPCNDKLFSFFGSKNNICIPFDDVVKIGGDTILVKYCDLRPVKR